MNPRRKSAEDLRKKGFSYNEIQQKLNIPKSTLSLWLRDIQLSDIAQKRLNKRSNIGTQILIRRNKDQTINAWKRAMRTQNTTMNEVGKLSHREILLVGAALYWGEGYKKLQMRDGKAKTSHGISFVNSDPEMVRFFMRFCRVVLKVPDDKFSLSVRLYHHMDPKKRITFWRKVTNLKQKNFVRPTFLESISSKRKRSFNRLPHGTLQIMVNDTERFHQILGWIAGLKKVS